MGNVKVQKEKFNSGFAKRTVKKFVIKDMKKRKKGSLQIQKKRLQLTPNKALKRRVA